MSGSIHALILGPAVRYLVDLGTFSGVTGFLNTLTGSISPATFKGLTITEAASSSAADFYFTVNGSLPQTAFSRLRVERGDGSWTSYPSESADYTTGSTTTWSWPPTGNRPWISTDAGEQHPIMVV